MNQPQEDKNSSDSAAQPEDVQQEGQDEEQSGSGQALAQTTEQSQQKMSINVQNQPQNTPKNQDPKKNIETLMDDMELGDEDVEHETVGENTMPLTNDQEMEDTQAETKKVIHPSAFLLESQSLKSWNAVCDSVSSLSAYLCEQLRIVMEPTKASKFKGDFKTGKKLNMRRIISFIASQYRNDKIWMRRTKPSKRQYRILLSIDDSTSMTVGNAGWMALHSLAMISQALNLLDAGEIGVVRFGTDAQVVVPFGKTMDETLGSALLNEFTFSQEQTDLAKLLYLSHQLMSIDHGKGSIFNKLHLILSDGVCQDHERLFSLLATSDPTCLTVFIILDNRAETDSIMNMKTVEFESDKVVFKHYMETFPFEYFVIVKDLNALPDLLCTVLKQFVESMQRG
jgi:midasin